MTPFAVQSLVLDLMNKNEVKDRLIHYKFEFCSKFENELALERSQYAEELFDYIYNIFFFRRAFNEEKDFKIWVDKLFSLDYRNPAKTMKDIQNSYKELVLINRDYFLRYFNFRHDDPDYISRHIQKDMMKFREKILGIY